MEKIKMRPIRWIVGTDPGMDPDRGLGPGRVRQRLLERGAERASASASAAAASSVAVSPPAPTVAAQPVTADDSVNEALRDYHRHHHGGLTTFISMAIDTLGLDEAKKASIEKIQSDLRAKMAPARDAEHDLLAAIADGVAAGKIDTAKVDAAVEKVATASAGIHAATADALTQLHDALAPVGASCAGRQGQGALGGLAQGQRRRRRQAARRKGGHLAKLTSSSASRPTRSTRSAPRSRTDVPVTPKTDPKAVDAHIQAFATAFVADKFDPKSLAAVGDRVGRSRRTARRGTAGALLRGRHAGAHPAAAHDAGGADPRARQRRPDRPSTTASK